MSLKFRILKIEDAPEALRSLYQPDPNGNGYVLAVEGAVDKARLDEFRNSNTELQKKLEEGTATLAELEAFKKQFGDHDIEHIQAALETKRRAEEKELIEKGEIDKLIENRTKDMKANHASELGRYKGELERFKGESEGYRSKFTDLLIESKVLDSVSGFGVLRAGARQDVLNRARSVWQLGEDGESLVAMAGKDRMFSAEDATKPLGIEEWASGLVQSSPYLFESTTGIGGKGSGQTQHQQQQGFVSRSDEAAKSSNIEAIAKGTVRVM